MARYQASEREARYRKAREWGLPPIVTEGDSWFSYELYLNMSDRIDDTKRFALKRLESSGDTVAEMIGFTPGADGISALKKVVEVERPRLLFFSGGGNDIAGPELKGAILPFHPLRKAENYLETDKWAKLIEKVRKGFEVLADEIGPLCPVFAHGYDYFIPSNRGIQIFPGVPGPGPWVWPQMVADNIGITDPVLQRGIARAMIDQFNDGVLARLEREKSGYFAHVDLRETLGSDSDWKNEIHPTSKGFHNLAKAFLKAVDAKLPDLRMSRALRLGGAVV